MIEVGELCTKLRGISHTVVCTLYTHMTESVCMYIAVHNIPLGDFGVVFFVFYTFTI